VEKLKVKLTEIIEGLNYYLYDVTYESEAGSYVLRVMIDNDTEISIDDCVKVSRVVSDALDEIDPFNEPYNFEVTSGGAERELRNSEEIKRAVGKPVYIETVDQKMEGILEKFKDGTIVIKHKNKRVSKIQYMDVSYIRLAIIF